MPFNLRRTIIHQPAGRIEPGDHIGNLDTSSRVTEVSREGDRVQLSFEDGSTRERKASDTLPVVRSE